MVGQNSGMNILELLYIPLDTLALSAEIFLTTSLLWVCRRPGREPTIFPSGEAAGSLAPLNARPHLLRHDWVISSDLPKSVSAEISAETEISVKTTDIQISVNNNQ